MVLHIDGRHFQLDPEMKCLHSDACRFRFALPVGLGMGSSRRRMARSDKSGCQLGVDSKNKKAMARIQRSIVGRPGL